MKCCFCNKELNDFGNFATPTLNGNYRCCDDCNNNIVLTIRHYQNFSHVYNVNDKNILKNKLYVYINKFNINLNIDNYII